jgi:hypothetical protein
MVSVWDFAPVAPIAEPATIIATSAAAPAHHAHLLVFRIPSLLEILSLSKHLRSAIDGDEDRRS